MKHATISRTALRLATAAAALALVGSACAAEDTTVAEPGDDSTVTTIAGDETTVTTTSDDPPLGAGPYPVATLEIEVTHPDSETIGYTISCLGDTATVTGEVDIDERAACLALAEDEVQTRLFEGPPADQVCTEIYGGPDEAHVTGTFENVEIDATIDRANGCGIADWDTLLGAVLPPAIGVTE